MISINFKKILQISYMLLALAILIASVSIYAMFFQKQKTNLEEAPKKVYKPEIPKQQQNTESQPAIITNDQRNNTEQSIDEKQIPFNNPQPPIKTTEIENIEQDTPKKDPRDANLNDLPDIIEKELFKDIDPELASSIRVMKSETNTMEYLNNLKKLSKNNDSQALQEYIKLVEDSLKEIH